MEDSEVQIETKILVSMLFEMFESAAKFACPEDVPIWDFEMFILKSFEREVASRYGQDF